MLGIIRVLTTTDENILLEHSRLMEERYPIKTVTHCIEQQPYGVYDEKTLAESIPKIVQLAKEMASQYDLDALTISCAGDPALDETRHAINIPVIGAGICGAHCAAMAGNKVGVIGITDAPPERLKKELADSFFSYSYVPNLRKSTDLFGEDAKKELTDKINEIIENGANTILFACTGFSTIHLKKYLSQKISIPVIDLVDAQAMAYQILKREVNE
ncbi:hypothetical protein BTS2_2544 [Bacillus sp. TS-2]|nr:hypothetical protein BTS2_2544 [Bacillus sp. TS-2]